MLSVLASVVVGVVLCVAGGSKLAIGRQWAAQASALGAPRFIVPFLPWIEIVSGALVLVRWQRGPVAIGVVALLAAFTVLIIVNLARGNRPHCACFGAWTARPLGWAHIVRNIALILCAIAAGV